MILKFQQKKKDDFKAFLTANNFNLTIDVSVIVLNSLYWPLSKQTDLHLAQDLLPGCRAFEEYYRRENDKKKITWLYNQGNCVVNYTFLDEKKKRKKVELSVSCTQACLLLLFNEQSQHKFEALRDALGVPIETLKYSISPLIFTKQRILGVKSAKKEKEPEPEDKPEEKPEEDDKKGDGEEGEDGEKKGGGAKKTAEKLEGEDVIGVVPLKGVQKKKLTFPAGNSIKSKIDDSKNIREKTNEERTTKIELALVRVMKSRNVMNIQELIAEATAQLCKFFRPDPKIMKKKN